MFGSNDKAMQIGGLQIGGLCPVIKLLMMSIWLNMRVDNNIQGVYQQSSYEEEGLLQKGLPHLVFSSSKKED